MTLDNLSNEEKLIRIYRQKLRSYLRNLEKFGFVLGKEMELKELISNINNYAKMLKPLVPKLSKECTDVISLTSVKDLRESRIDQIKQFLKTLIVKLEE